jgi:hypothetical protein
VKKSPTILKRLTLYPLVAITFSALALFIMLISFGYTLKYEDGRIVTTKTGIIIVASNPGDAEVYLNGELHRKKTSALPFFNLKINRLPAGEYDVKIVKEDYMPWEGQVTVKPGFVSWLDYLLLVPLEKEEKPFNIPGELTKVIVSNDKNLILASAIDKEQEVQTIWRVDSNSKSKAKILEVNLKDKGAVDPIIFSFGNDRFLYREKIGETENLKVREAKVDGQSWDITSQFGMQYDTLVFSPYSHDELYGLRGSNLYKINFSQRNMSASLANDVVGIYPNESELLLVQNTNDNYGLWRIAQNNDLKNIIKALPASKKYQVNLVKDPNYYLVNVVDEKDLMLYTNGVKNPTLETISKNNDYFRVSPNGKRIVIKSENILQVYDLDDEKYYQISDSEKITAVDWFSDNSNLVFVQDNELRLVNYNGFYNQPLFKIDSKNPIVVATNNNHIYFTKTLKETLDLFVFSF